MHRAFLGARNPSRAPTTKDFPEEGWPVEIGQSSWLSAPDRPEQGRDKVDVLTFYKSNQISDDRARLIRVVWRVGDDRGAIRASQIERIFQMFGFRSIERLARNVAVSGGVHIRVEIGQPHVDPQRAQGRAGARRRRRTDRGLLVAIRVLAGTTPAAGSPPGPKESDKSRYPSARRR
jgi:hypothetical protein